MNKNVRDTIMDICIGMMCAFIMCGSAYAWIPITIYFLMVFVTPREPGMIRAKSNQSDKKETG
jgi:hypothetical protein